MDSGTGEQGSGSVHVEARMLAGNDRVQRIIQHSLALVKLAKMTKSPEMLDQHLSEIERLLEGIDG